MSESTGSSGKKSLAVPKLAPAMIKKLAAVALVVVGLLLLGQGALGWMQYANEVKILSCQPNEFSLEGEQWGGHEKKLCCSIAGRYTAGDE